ncbi:hypothetical protein [Paenibacillus fonticola]|uniref:hypothetical protein n=1 Tax=Paenibacillus fonticola TaxID=379896 RepID=UPI000360390F|nr:hypothetical protein [Paenibacillus fonticola]
MRKRADEMQLSQATRATKWLGLFYSVSLLIWTLYDVVMHNELGIQFIILMAGMLIFFGSLIVLKRSVR